MIPMGSVVGVQMIQQAAVHVEAVTMKAHMFLRGGNLSMDTGATARNATPASAVHLGNTTPIALGEPTELAIVIIVTRVQQGSTFHPHATCGGITERMVSVLHVVPEAAHVELVLIYQAVEESLQVHVQPVLDVVILNSEADVQA